MTSPDGLAPPPPALRRVLGTPLLALYGIGVIVGAGIYVLVDDIVSYARTMIEACRHMVAAGLPRPVCVAVHALFAGDAFQSLRQVAGRIVTTNTVPHETNAIDIAPLFGRSLLDLPREGRARGS